MYIPQSMLTVEVRREMWDLVDAELEKLRGGQVLLLGDMNARLWSRQPGEEGVIGCHMLQTRDWREGEDDGDLNRAMLIQTLRPHDLFLANTAFQHRPSHTVTFRDLQVRDPLAPTHPLHCRFDVLDHVATPTKWLRGVKDIRDYRERRQSLVSRSQSSLPGSGDITHSLFMQTKATSMQEMAS